MLLTLPQSPVPGCAISLIPYEAQEIDLPAALHCADMQLPYNSYANFPVLLLQGAAYYLGMLAYYWVLVTPSVSFLFGCYLYLSVNWFHVHYDEAFSSLQIPHHKGFSRMHITPDGDLHIYGLAIDKVGPCQLWDCYYFI